MLRACFAQCSRSSIIPSWSSAPHLSFHTTAVASATSRSVKKRNNLKKEQRWREAQARKPSVVLGTRPDDEAKWENSYLRNVIIDMDKLAPSAKTTPAKLSVGTVNMPEELGFGIGQAEKELLFEHLPMLSTQTGINSFLTNADEVEAAAHREAAAQEREKRKANAFAKLVDLRNMNAAGIAYENRKRIIAAFSTPQNPFDPGRSEVQAALLTYKIRNLWDHLRTFKRDVGNRRGLRKLVHQRAKILKYLKREDQNRYETILTQLALEPESVEGELVM